MVSSFSKTTSPLLSDGLGEAVSLLGQFGGVSAPRLHRARTVRFLTALMDEIALGPLIIAVSSDRIPVYAIMIPAANREVEKY